MRSPTETPTRRCRLRIVADITTLCLLILVTTAGCSFRRFAVNRLGDLLTSGSASAFETDSDVELVGDALPFSLKLLESLLAASPSHQGLRLAACRGFVVYSYGWVDFPAETTWEEDYEQGRRLRERAGRLYLRAHDHCLAGLEARYTGLATQLHDRPDQALSKVGAGKSVDDDVALLYWAASSLGLAISSDLHDVSLLARLPEAEALAARALEIDEAWQHGALHELAMSLAAASVGGPDFDVIERHYQRALELSGGNSPGLFVSYAELVAVPRQDRNLFRELLNKALALDPQSEPSRQLEATLAQRRALWLLGRIDDLILDDSTDEPTSGQGERP